MEYTKLLGKVTLTTDGLHDSAEHMIDYAQYMTLHIDLSYPLKMYQLTLVLTIRPIGNH